MKSLRIIMILAKIARIVCLVLFILTIIGLVGCIAASIIVPSMWQEVVYNGKTLEMIFAEKNINFVTVQTAIGIGIFSLLVTIFLTKYAELFFGHVVKQGTPFEMVTVKKMRTLAIVNIAVEIASCIIVAITLAIVKHLHPELADFNNSAYYVGSVSFGIYMLILSLFVEYGTLKSNPVPEEKKEVTEQE